MALDDEERLGKIYEKLEGVPDDKWRAQEQYFETSLGGYTFRLYGSYDDGCVMETGVCVLDSSERPLHDFDHAPGLSDVFGRLVKRELELEAEKEEDEKEKSKGKFDDFLDM
ncbi:hypothetical protein KY335_05935 [Candidatus Woesearchaeota archaeon]|nr:hypothetical protein [Candidatus Woesearchaeota archaeon]